MFKKILKFIDYLHYCWAVKKADDAHEKTGERYYVLPSTNGKLIIMDRRNFRLLRRKKYIMPTANVNNMIGECFYCTPYRNGNGYLSKEGREQKLKQYYAYRDAMRNSKKK